MLLDKVIKKISDFVRPPEEKAEKKLSDYVGRPGKSPNDDTYEIYGVNKEIYEIIKLNIQQDFKLQDMEIDILELKNAVELLKAQVKYLQEKVDKKS